MRHLVGSQLAAEQVVWTACSGGVKARGLAALVAPGIPFDERMFRLVGPQQLWTGAKRFVRRGRYGAASIGFRAAANLWSEELGSEHPHVGSAIAWLAWTEVKLGRLSDAVVHYRQALDIAVSYAGPIHPRAAMLREDLDWVMLALREEPRGRPPGPPDRHG